MNMHTLICAHFLLSPWWLSSLSAYLCHSNYNLETEVKPLQSLMLIDAVGGVTSHLCPFHLCFRKEGTVILIFHTAMLNTNASGVHNLSLSRKVA